MSQERREKETRKSRSPSPKGNGRPRKSKSRSRSAKRTEKKRSRSRSGGRRSRDRGSGREGRSRSRGRDRRDDRRGGARRDDRDKPTPSEILGVFGLSPKTDQALLEDIFGQHGKLDKVTLITDRSTGMSRGFGFLYFKSIDDATRAKEACDGMTIDGRKIRTDYSLTHKAHDPTPGKYLGRSTRRDHSRDRDRGDRRDDRGGDRRDDRREGGRDERYRPRERSGSPRYDRYSGPGGGRDRD